MKLLLPDQKCEIKFGVKHVEEQVVYNYNAGSIIIPRRGTRVWLKVDAIPGKLGFASGEVKAECFCHPNDNFSKKTGRKLAASRLLGKLGTVLSKRDKKAIFEAICPEYRNGE